MVRKFRPAKLRAAGILTLLTITTATACSSTTGATDVPPESSNSTAATSISPAIDSSTTVQAHLDAATQNAFGDAHLIDTYRKYSCFEVEDPSIRDEYRGGAGKRVPLTKVLDGLWFIGDGYVGQYILETASGGLALIDTLNDSIEFQTYTLPALESLGLSDTKPLEGVFISHGHFDHDGGAPAIRAHFGPDLPIYLGSGDAPDKTFSPTLIDTSNPETKEIAIGGTRIYAQPAPGHTPGNLVGFVPMEHEGKSQMLLVNGRSAVPKTVDLALQYLKGTELQYDAARRLGATGTIHTHTLSDGSLRQIESMNRAGTSDPDFILGKEQTLQAAAIWRECAAARITELDPTVKIPVWRSTAIELSKPEFTTEELSATVTSPWGPVADEVVTFRAGTDVVCTATTDSDGRATCESNEPMQSGQEVSATFDGSEKQTYVNLPSTST